MATVKLDRVCKVYPNGHVGVAEASFDIADGELLVLVGPSGCGKTTLLRMIAGFIAPDAGDIAIGGNSMQGVAPKNRDIAMVFQSYALYPHMSVAENIAYPLKVRKLPRAEIDKQVRDVAAQVQLDQLLERFPRQLSGGQRQRVAIARALISGPRMVICDEPTSALDVSVQSQILNLLQDLRVDFGLTYLLISHNLAVVEHMATRVAVMYLGRIVEEAETDRFFQAPKHPYGAALLTSVLTPEPGLGVPDTQLGAAYPDPLDVPSGCRFHPRCARVMDQCRTIAPQPIAAADGFVECHLYDPRDQRG